ncbi:uncharacterized protein LOC119269558 [Triticum dicoccoides]|uniref:uncharacterized protein LOC119269558 n=1 Tax=Triticum dicoccoides TaxID=85692 RepID=UPI00188E6C9C|nr:uncharacterized protein LOC119269558 [Triticum dicoccoides]XP_044342080.1 uncharacterized protein LOC123062566 isoform X1 [Triticum aestivum]
MRSARARRTSRGAFTRRGRPEASRRRKPSPPIYTGAPARNRPPPIQLVQGSHSFVMPWKYRLKFPCCQDFFFNIYEVASKVMVTAAHIRVTDEDYCGPMGVVLFNYSEADFTVKPRDRVIQIVV